MIGVTEREKEVVAYIEYLMTQCPNYEPDWDMINLVYIIGNRPIPNYKEETNVNEKEVRGSGWPCSSNGTIHYSEGAA